MGDAVVTTDGQFRVTSWNRGAEAMYGWSAEEVLGHSVGALLGTAWADDQARFESMRALAQEGCWRGEVVQRRRDGRLLHVLASVTRLRDERGDSVGAVAVNRDVTAQRQAEEALAQMGERLAEVQRQEALTAVAGSLAHDLNNLLTVIGGHAELAKEMLPDGHRARPSLEQVGAAVRRGEALMAQLLAIARDDTVELAVIDVGAAVARQADALRRVIGAEHRLDLEVSSAFAKVSARELEEVLVNLVTNAREALPRPGVVRVRVLTEGPEKVVVEVSDDGVGMPPEVLPRAAEAFFSTKPSGRGTGLGLAVVSRVVTRWGGDLRLWSEPGRGTRVSLVVPASEAPVDVARAWMETGSLRVLLAEDQEPVREVLSQLLRSLGHQVVAVGDGAEAVERGREAAFDLLVTDVSMPRLSGPAAAAVLRAERPDLPIVYLSGFPREDAGGTGGAWPPGAFRRKPVRREELAEAIGEATAVLGKG